MQKIAIIGAGLAGLTLATRLRETASVLIVEKSRGLGGRLATRRAGNYEFDHGAQYLTARSQEFRRFLREHFTGAQLQDWQPRTLTLSEGEKPYRRPWFEPHWVGVPAMSSLGKELARGLEVELQVRVNALQRDAAGWQLQLDDGSRRGPFDWVVTTAPAPQSLALLPEAFAGHQQLQQVRMSACFALMLGFEQTPTLPFQAARLKDPVLGWLALNSHKPGRAAGASLLVQSNNHWADEHLERPEDWVQAQLLGRLAKLVPGLPDAKHVALHRWRFAATTTPLEEDFLLDDTLQLAACGDWCRGGRVEAAFTSADRLAQALLDRQQAPVITRNASAAAVTESGVDTGDVPAGFCR